MNNYNPDEHSDCYLCKRIAEEIEKLKKDEGLDKLKKQELISKYQRIKAKSHIIGDRK